MTEKVNFSNSQINNFGFYSDSANAVSIVLFKILFEIKIGGL